MGDGPAAVRQACETAFAALTTALAGSSVTGSRAEWAAVLRAAQQVVDVASAVQDAGIARLAAIEPAFLEDGTEVETHRALGHMALDAPAIVSGVLAASSVHAERRVREAVLLAADGPAGSDSETGLGGLHTAMAAGRLDSYRASVLAEELGETPPEVAATVVTALDAYFEVEDAAHLRRRCRRALARISPDLLVQRAQRARAQSGLRRWAEEPGVDRWEGTFPSEEAAQAWAAIDALAQRYVAEAVCATIERARAKALTDLVAGNATIEAVVTVTVPSTVLPDTVLPATVLPATVVPATVLPATVVPASVVPATVVPASPDPGPMRAGASAPRPRPEREIHAGRESDLHSHAQPEALTGPASATVNPGDDLLEVGGLRAGDPVLVSRAWVEAAVHAPGAAVHVAPCHPVTGALAPPRPAVGSGAEGYRPPVRMAQRVRARDGRCRFPGCTVAAVFCDLDHARPWPAGRTVDDNLMCLCRRHHRVKQRPGWRVVLATDGVATWTDPTGRVRTTAPVDALRATVLPGAAAIPRLPHSASRARTVLPDGPHSALEFLLEHRGAGHDERETARYEDLHWSDRHHRRSIDLTPPRHGIRLEQLATVPHPPVSRRARRRRAEHDPPPF